MKLHFENGRFYFESDRTGKGRKAREAFVQAYCPCGGVILADTEDWAVPICNECYEALGEPKTEPGLSLLKGDT